MNKKLFLGVLLLAGFVFLSTGMVFASDDLKPYDLLERFGGYRLREAKELGVDRDDLMKERNELREAHREQRMEERRLRMEEGGCLSAEEIEERLQTRKGRFAK